jgi:ribose transport system substrate-binding protein
MKITSLVRLGIKASVWLLLAVSLTAPLFAQKKLNSVAVTVGDLGNPFFVQIAHGAEAQAKKYNPAVKFTAESSNYDVKNQTNQMDNFISSGVNLILLNAADSKGIAPRSDAGESCRNHRSSGRRGCGGRGGRRGDFEQQAGR